MIGMRRLRANSNIRELVNETRVNIKDFIYPLFVTEGSCVKNIVPSMPDVFQMSIDNILNECEQLQKSGIYNVILFGIVECKDSMGSSALDESSLICRAIRAIKSRYVDMYVISDLCMCEYTDHGHCGVIDIKSSVINNNKTLKLLGKQALLHANAGVDMIAPSGMMDGVVSYLRGVLNDGGYSHIPIMSYSTKFSSGYYGPFRDIVNSAPSFGDRKSYQMNFANSKEALRESLIDEKEGADILMVKPALVYCDIIKEISSNSLLPVCAYNVSGEYSMLKLAQKHGLIDYETVLFENMVALKRAGAKIIISYHAKELAKLL